MRKANTDVERFMVHELRKVERRYAFAGYIPVADRDNMDTKMTIAASVWADEVEALQLSGVYGCTIEDPLRMWFAFEITGVELPDGRLIGVDGYTVRARIRCPESKPRRYINAHGAERWTRERKYITAKLELYHNNERIVGRRMV